MWYREENYGVMVAEERPSFDLIENDRGELLLTVTPMPGPADTPLMIISTRGSKALFRRRHGQIITLTDINQDILEKLRKARRILIAEIDRDQIIHSYYATITTGQL